MTNNPTQEVQKYGQSLWYDNLSREMIQSGELQMLIDDYGIMGLTSNPTIFEKAIGEGNAYDEWIRDSLEMTIDEVFDGLAITDIQSAADILRPIYDRTTDAFRRHRDHTERGQAVIQSRRPSQPHDQNPRHTGWFACH